MQCVNEATGVLVWRHERADEEIEKAADAYEVADRTAELREEPGRRLVDNLGQRLREIADNPALQDGPEPPPPHY